MPKWEYCKITGISQYEHMHCDTKCYRMTLHGEELVADFRQKRGADINAVARVIAQLGEDGWEMVGAGNVNEELHNLYFKRLKS